MSYQYKITFVNETPVIVSEPYDDLELCKERGFCQFAIVRGYNYNTDKIEIQEGGKTINTLYA